MPTSKYNDIASEVQALKALNLSITDAINALVEVYADIHSLNPYSINCGCCEEFANDLSEIVFNAIPTWGDELTDPGDDVDLYGDHCFVEYDGKYYDAECPEGVEDFRQIPCFIHNQLPEKQRIEDERRKNQSSNQGS